MARKKQTKGACGFCGREMTRSGLGKHLNTCAARQEAIETADAGRGKSQPLLHLQVQDAWAGDFWLHLEINGSATLGDLDNYLRAIWLECCGHLSQFSVGGWRGDEISMSRAVRQVLQPGVDLTHIYDFGTSSETLVKVIGERMGKPLTKHPIKLMARNNMLKLECQECGKQATWLCTECIYEDQESGLLCDDHAKDHPHDDYGPPTPFYNSPRMGMCGYDGPAEAPY